jgi:hypothetical protein
MDEYKVDGYKLHREPVPVQPNRIGRLIEVLTAAVFVVVIIYLLR